MTVITVSIIFGVTWLADSFNFVLHFYKPSFNKLTFAATSIFVLFNSAINPILYALINQRYKEKMKGKMSYLCRQRNGKLSFATNAQGSDYYHQVQMSLYVLDFKKAVFAVWKPGEHISKRLLTFTVERSSEWAAVNVPLLQLYMDKVIRPLRLKQARIKLLLI